MQIRDIIWIDVFVDKILRKHHVKTDEVEEVLKSIPKIRFIEDGDIEGENMYTAMGRTKSGRYLVVFFILKKNGSALVVSARDMSRRERKLYEKK
ncbi:MAG: BrnT family toxin [Nitrospirae bacterium]|nr:BrnT family toxin [Nitrospirota bacterium]